MAANDEQKSSEEPTDDLVTSRHSVTVDGEALAYTATTGRIVLRQEKHTDGTFDGNVAKAEVFLTAYTLDGADPGRRPVTFAFNGGPGSASVWLHLGLLGPRRVVSGDVGSLAKPPYGLVDNAETLLAVSDLVFIDPVSTGYSRAVKGGKPEEFHGFAADVEYISEVIRLWTSRHDRWMSPKFIAGESYGTTRGAAIAERLQSRYGMYFNGLMLISTALDFNALDFSEGNELPYALFLPTYAAIAHYHGLHGSRPLAEVLAEATAFAERDYLWALVQGSRLSAADRQSIVDRVAAITGLSAEYVDRVNFRIEHVRFFTELLRSRRLTVGRIDGRFTGWEADYGREHFSHDPSISAITGPYASALNHYLRGELGYQNDLPYEVLTDRVRPWSYKDFENAHVTVADKLAAAMRINPDLRVHIGAGYHDGATPFAGSDYVVAHLAIPDELRANIDLAYYEAGHMMYVHEPSRLQQSAHLADFIRSAANR
jgi:carboxypeptidase C (cathepsin A)